MAENRDGSWVKGELDELREWCDKLQADNQRLRAELEKAIERLEQGKPCLAKNILYCALDRPQQDGDGLEGMSMLRPTLDQGGE